MWSRFAIFLVLLPCLSACPAEPDSHPQAQTHSSPTATPQIQPPQAANAAESAILRDVEDAIALSCESMALSNQVLTAGKNQAEHDAEMQRHYTAHAGRWARSKQTSRAIQKSDNPAFKQAVIVYMRERIEACSNPGANPSTYSG